MKTDLNQPEAPDFWQIMQQSRSSASSPPPHRNFVLRPSSATPVSLNLRLVHDSRRFATGAGSSTRARASWPSRIWAAWSTGTGGTLPGPRCSLCLSPSSDLHVVHMEHACACVCACSHTCMFLHKAQRHEGHRSLQSTCPAQSRIHSRFACTAALGLQTLQHPMRSPFHLFGSVGGG